MGARISIELQGLLNCEGIKLTFEATVQPPQGEDDSHTINQSVEVSFGNEDSAMHYWFDVTSHDSKVTLEKDFNFFRDEERHRALMWSLFAHSVPFTVIPG